MSKLLLADPRYPFCVIVETAVGPLLTTSGRCQRESRRGPWHCDFLDELRPELAGEVLSTTR